MAKPSNLEFKGLFPLSVIVLKNECFVKIIMNKLMPYTSHTN